MKATSTNVGTILLVTSILFVGLSMLQGCKKSEPVPAEPPAGAMQGHEGHDHAAMMDEAATAVAAAVEQTTCPVMGGAIDKSIFIEYEGKKVYFCCAGCEEQFKKEPEKYIAKLPQFKD